MRSILILSLLFLISITLAFRSFEPGKNDLDGENLNGRVKTVVAYANGSAGVSHNGRGFSLKSISSYNFQGNLTEAQFYDTGKEEKLFLSWIYVYDAQGRKISISNKSGDVMSTSVYSYNSKHQLTETVYNEKQISFYIVYNDKGTRDSTLFYDMAGKIMGSAKYQYDIKGNLTKETRYKPDNAFDYKMLYKYDSKQNKLQETRHTPDGKDSWTAFEYDKKGHVIMEADSNIIRIRGVRENIPPHNADQKGNVRTHDYYNTLRN